MRGIRGAGPEVHTSHPTPPCLTFHFICKWMLTLICYVKPQKKKKEKKKHTKKTTLLLYKVKFLL